MTTNLHNLGREIRLPYKSYEQLSFLFSGIKLSQEKQLEKSTWNKDHHRAMENLRKEHKRELDVSNC